jgi:hypothetical protein
MAASMLLSLMDGSTTKSNSSRVVSVATPARRKNALTCAMSSRRKWSACGCSRSTLWLTSMMYSSPCAGSRHTVEHHAPAAPSAAHVQQHAQSDVMHPRLTAPGCRQARTHLVHQDVVLAEVAVHEAALLVQRPHDQQHLAVRATEPRLQASEDQGLGARYVKRHTALMGLRGRATVWMHVLGLPQGGRPPGGAPAAGRRPSGGARPRLRCQ